MLSAHFAAPVLCYRCSVLHTLARHQLVLLRPPHCSMRVTTSENGITNAIEIYRTAAGQLRVVCSNNDCMVRCCVRCACCGHLLCCRFCACTAQAVGGGSSNGYLVRLPAGSPIRAAALYSHALGQSCWLLVCARPPVVMPVRCFLLCPLS